MDIGKMIKSEIEIEEKVLAKYKNNVDPAKKSYSLRCKNTRGTDRFYIKGQDDKKEQYAGIDKKDLLSDIYEIRFNKAMTEVLEENIRTLKKADEKIKPYDHIAIEDIMPRAYKHLKCRLDSAKNVQQLLNSSTKSKIASMQSENPYKRESLIYRTRFGLLVRSKNELVIAESLYTAGLDFYYEKRLDLVDRGINDSRHVYYNDVTVYPDFTIIKADGETIYWEHMGMMDKEDYREECYKKLQLYFENSLLFFHPDIRTS